MVFFGQDASTTKCSKWITGVVGALGLAAHIAAGANPLKPWVELGF